MDRRGMRVRQAPSAPKDLKAPRETLGHPARRGFLDLRALRGTMEPQARKGQSDLRDRWEVKACQGPPVRWP